MVRVISPNDLRDNDLVAYGGGKGSPTVRIEKFTSDDYVHTALLKILPDKYFANIYKDVE